MDSPKRISSQVKKDQSRNKKLCLKNSKSKSDIRSDTLTVPGGISYYVCIYCNKLFKFEKLRTEHMIVCKAKSYIFSVSDRVEINEKASEINHTTRICVHQNIELTTGKNGDSNSSEYDNPYDFHENYINTPFDKSLLETTRRSKLSFEERLKNISKKLKENELMRVFSEEHENLNNNEVTKFDETVISNKKLKDNVNKVEDNLCLSKNEDEEHHLVLPNLTNDEPDCNEDTTHTCKSCKINFSTAVELLKHGREKHRFIKVLVPPDHLETFYNIEDRSFCPICEKPMNSTYKSFYIKHLQTHRQERDYKCAFCQKTFRRMDHKMAHERRHAA